MSLASHEYKPIVFADSEWTSWKAANEHAVFRVCARRWPGPVVTSALLAISTFLGLGSYMMTRQINGTIGPYDLWVIIRCSALAALFWVAVIVTQRWQSRDLDPLRFERSNRRVSLPRLGLEFADREVQQVQLAKFRVAAVVGQSFRVQWYRHVVLVVRHAGSAPSFYPILTSGYGLGRVGRSIASELGVPFEIVRLGAVTP